MPYKDFAVGEVLTSADVDTYLMRQAVMVFDDATARTTALSGVVTEGMVTYRKDSNVVEFYDGSQWVSADSEIPDQSGNANKFLQTDGSSLSFVLVDATDLAQLTSGVTGQTIISNGTAGVTYENAISPLMLIGA